MGHNLDIFLGISLLVVVKLSFVTEKFPSGEESYFDLCDVLSVLHYEKLCPIVLLFVYYYYYFFFFILIFVIFVNVCDR